MRRWFCLPILLIAVGAMTYLSIAGGQAAATKIATWGAPLRTWKASDGPKAFPLEDVTLSLSAAQDKDGQPIAKLEASLPGTKPLTLLSEFGLDDPTVTFDVFPIDPKNSKKDILFSWFLGGAHCCGRVLVASLIDDAWIVADLGSFDGEQLDDRPLDVNGDGVPDFVFGDDRFLYLFASYADSVSPRRVFNVVRGKVVELSADPAFAPLHREDAAEFERLCRQHSNPGCAAFVASSARLGRYEPALQEALRNYDRKSDWDIPLCAGPEAGCGPQKTTTNFADALPIFLRQTGYIH